MTNKRDPLVEAVSDLPPGSKAPACVAVIFGDKQLSQESKVALADMFMTLCRLYTKDGKLWVFPEAE